MHVRIVLGPMFHMVTYMLNYQNNVIRIETALLVNAV